MRTTIALLLFLLAITPASAQRLVYDKADSLKVVSLLASAPKAKTTAQYVLHFGEQLAGTPYVAKTLDKDLKENLVVNLRQLDCTTFTETAFALALCMKNDRKSFADFARYLRLLRYERGHISYDKRQHYFTSWIEGAKRQGFVSEPEYPAVLAPKDKLLEINYMTKHVEFYPQLKDNAALRDSISRTEASLTGSTFRFIPKNQLKKHKALQSIVNSGDIIVIITNKAGLDTSHIGIASWHKDGTLHLLNASQLHKKVIDEPLPLFDYMQRHPSQTGIRVLSVN